MTTLPNTGARTRVGKIARLPRAVRGELNRRLAEGEVGTRLVAWLNGLREVRAVLRAEFGGRAITDGNLSEWKQGGYEDWRRGEETRAWVSAHREEMEELEEAGAGASLADTLASLVLLELARLLRSAQAAPEGPEQSRLILDISDRLCEIRRTAVLGRQAAFAEEKWGAAQQTAAEQRAKEALQEMANKMAIAEYQAEKAREAADEEARCLGSRSEDAPPTPKARKAEELEARAQAMRGYFDQIRPSPTPGPEDGRRRPDPAGSPAATGSPSPAHPAAFRPHARN